MTDRDKARDKLLIEIGFALEALCSQFKVDLQTLIFSDRSVLKDAVSELDYEMDREEEREREEEEEEERRV